TGEEPFLNQTLASVGVPALHILRAYNSEEYRFYELTGDLKEALHFKHFEKPPKLDTQTPSAKIRLGDEVADESIPVSAARGRVVLLDE
ncbi:MAG: hypothetical protein C0391_04260, partial [Anaerolinea sp.]|nr:hypothetical protein [Anaerolinea sp.]